MKMLTLALFWWAKGYIELGKWNRIRLNSSLFQAGDSQYCSIIVGVRVSNFSTTILKHSWTNWLCLFVVFELKIKSIRVQSKSSSKHFKLWSKFIPQTLFLFPWLYDIPFYRLTSEDMEQIGTSFAAETNRRDEDADM